MSFADLTVVMCPLDFLWRHYWMFPWQFATAWSSFGEANLMLSVCGMEFKLHYYLVNWATVRNYWKMTAPFCDNFWDFKMHLFNFRVRKKKILFFWKNERCQNVYFCFKFSFWPLPVSPEMIRESALEGRNSFMVIITKIHVSKKILSLKSFFLTVQRKNLRLGKNVAAALSQAYCSFARKQIAFKTLQKSLCKKSWYDNSLFVEQNQMEKI